MGQLIKLQDYISRYESNIYLYPSRFVRLKKQQWERLKGIWENIEEERLEQPFDLSWIEDEKPPILQKIKGMFRFGSKDTEIKSEEVKLKPQIEEQDSSGFQFSATLHFRPDTIEDLKQQFLDQLFRFQMKWASSTITEVSQVAQKFYFDEQLKFFLQRFPDTFLILFRPIFLLKKAPVEVEIILLTPTDVWCITMLEEEDNAVFLGSNEHFWTKNVRDQERKVLNPLLSLNRTEKIIKKLFELYEVDLPIRKIVLSRNGYIDHPTPPFDVQYIEKRNFDQWFRSMRSLRSPLKAMQLKGAQALLEYCQTTCIRRLEWEEVDEVEEENRR